MFEMMNTGFESPMTKQVTHKYDFTIEEYISSLFVQGLGQTASGDLTLSAAGNASTLIYGKNESGLFAYKQTAFNAGWTGPYAVPTDTGFVISTPEKPTARGSLAVWEQQPNGQYIQVANPKEAGAAYGQMGAQGGLAYVKDWLFSGVAFDGSILVSFNKSAGNWVFKNYVTKDGNAYFASQCIRALSDTEIIVGSAYETHSSKTYAGAIYLMSITAAGAVQKQRIVPAVTFQQGMFGTSIAVINKNRIVVTARNTNAESWFYTFERPNESSPFVEVSSIMVPGAISSGINIVYGSGMIFCGDAIYNGSRGMSAVLSIDKAGKLSYLPELTILGTQSGQYFGAAHQVIGNELFILSQWRIDTSKKSVVSVYDIQG